MVETVHAHPLIQANIGTYEAMLLQPPASLPEATVAEGKMAGEPLQRTGQELDAEEAIEPSLNKETTWDQTNIAGGERDGRLLVFSLLTKAAPQATFPIKWLLLAVASGLRKPQHIRDRSITNEVEGANGDEAAVFDPLPWLLVGFALTGVLATNVWWSTLLGFLGAFALTALMSYAHLDSEETTQR